MDEFPNALLVILVGALVLLNSYASFIVIFKVAAGKGQKFAQLLFIWVLPFVGAILAISLHRDSVPMKPRKLHGNLTSITDDDGMILNRTHRQDHHHHD